MESITERFLVIWDFERLEAKWLEKETAVKEARWYTIRKTKDMRTSELEKVQDIFPEYRYWLSTGQELPEAGQVSPMTKRAQRALKTRPAEG